MITEREQLIDWTLALLALGTIASQLGLQAAGSDVRAEATVAEVREVEQPAKLADAERALSPEVREALGLGGEDSESEGRVLEELRRDLEEARARPRLLMSIAAVAASSLSSEEAGALALEALDLVFDNEEAAALYAGPIDTLYRLARGREASGEEAAAAARAVGGSRWMICRLEAAAAAARREAADKERAQSCARDAATLFVERFTLLSVVVVSFFLVGALLIVLWPLVRRAILGAGFSGLEGTASPFVVASTLRVVSAWFLLFVAVGTLVATLAVASGDTGATMALGTAVQTLAGGGVAIALIGRFGRRGVDAAPLAVPLRLGVGPRTGGLPGLLLGVIGGLAIALVVVLVALLVVGGEDGGATGTQPILVFFAEQSDLGPRLVIGLSAVVFAPVFEEILFRGFLFRNLKEVMDPTFAMAASGLAFGLAHMDLGALLPLAALGATLAFLYERSGTLLVPIGVHSLWNLGSLAATLLIAEG